MSARAQTTACGTGHGVPDYISKYVSRFEVFARSVETDSPIWLRRLRAEAMKCFSELGFPTTRAEDWRYTDVSAIAETEFELATPPPAGLSRQQLEPLLLPGGDVATAVFVNGRFSPELSADPGARGENGGVRVESLAQLRAAGSSHLQFQLARQLDLKQHAFAALNTAFLDDGALVTTAKGQAAARPIHLLFISTAETARAAVCHPRIAIALEPQSRATVIEDHVCLGSTQTFSNSVTEVSVGENAQLDLVVLERGSDFHIANLQTHQDRDSRLRCHTLALGGTLVRNDLNCVLGDTGAECELQGLFLGMGEQLVDNHTLVDHAVPHGSSRQLYKGILGGRSRGVFRGRVVVRPGAQKTSAEQYNPNLLLSEGSDVNTKPQLEIYADDVKCSHGSTVGRMDPEALFFLRSRGIAEARAREMLTQGFAAEIASTLPTAELAEAVGELIAQRIRNGVGEGESG